MNRNDASHRGGHEGTILDEALGQLRRILDRLPMVPGLRRDLEGFRKLLFERRAPRLAVVERTGGRDGRAVLDGLLGMQVAPLDVDDPQFGPGRWIRVDTSGTTLDWLHVMVDGEPSGGGRTAIRRARDDRVPDCVLFIVDVGELDLDGDARNTIKAYADVWRMLSAGSESDALPRPLALVIRKHGEHDAGREAAAASVERLENVLTDTKLADTDVMSLTARPPGAGVGMRIDPTDLQRLSDAVFGRLPEQAKLEAARAFVHCSDARRRVAQAVVDSAATLAATVAVTPIPLSDVWILAPLQFTMVSAIAHLGGHPWDRRAIKRWLGSMGVVGGAGLGLRWTAQQLLKFIPAAGTFVSAGIAAAGTTAVGRSAMTYFLR